MKNKFKFLGKERDSIDINDLSRECIEGCSHSGQCFSDVEFWRRKLNFRVNKESAIRYLSQTGGWTLEELNEHTNDGLANKILWLACGEFSEYIFECEAKNIDPFKNTDYQSNCGSSWFNMYN
jgi:hypothetical protein